MVDDLKNIIEAVLLVSDNPVSAVRIQGLFDEEAQPEIEQIHAAFLALEEDCDQRGIELRKIGSGYRFQTREKYADYLRKLHAEKPPKMSRALLETLAIIAYRQPVSRGDIEEIRGVSVSTDIMQRLIEREWVKQVGVRDVPGRPGLFGTTNSFLSYFNLSSLKELPPLMDERGLGEISGELEIPLPREMLDALEGKQEQQQDIVSVSQDANEEEIAAIESTQSKSGESNDSDAGKSMATDHGGNNPSRQDLMSAAASSAHEDDIDHTADNVSDADWSSNERAENDAVKDLNQS